jgi:hypothetical protein
MPKRRQLVRDLALYTLISAVIIAILIAAACSRLPEPLIMKWFGFFLFIYSRYIWLFRRKSPPILESKTVLGLGWIAADSALRHSCVDPFSWSGIPQNVVDLCCRNGPSYPSDQTDVSTPYKSTYPSSEAA